MGIGADKKCGNYVAIVTRALATSADRTTTNKSKKKLKSSEVKTHHVECCLGHYSIVLIYFHFRFAHTQTFELRQTHHNCVHAASLSIMTLFYRAATLVPYISQNNYKQLWQLLSGL